MTLSHIA